MMFCQSCSVTQRKCWLYGWATLFSIGAIVILLLWPKWSTHLMHKSLVIEVGTDNYKNWVKTPIPIYLKFYLFNWTNPQNISNPHVKPHFVEMGPYVFLEEHSKENLTFHSNHTVSYYQRRTWHYIANASNGSLDDLVTAPHVVTATVADEMRHKNPIIKKIINFMLRHEGGKLYVSKPVREWIFDGYQDRLIDFLRMFNTSKIDMPYKRFGWMVDRNNSLEYDGLFTIHTGRGNINNLGMLNHWNGRSVTGFYPPPCGVVNGTAGDLFPPTLPSQQYLTIFANDACRYLNLQLNGSIDVLGLKALKWEGTEETLDSGENFSSQQCFCNSTLEKCPKAGVVNCKECRNHAPIYASFPHFLSADQSYKDAITGLNPNPLKHKFMLAVEPTTGIPVQINARLQINMLLSSNPDFDIYSHVQNVMMPLFWFEQTATLSKVLADKTKVASNLEKYGQYSSIALLCLGLALFMLGLYLTITKKWTHVPKDDDDEAILIHNSQADDLLSNQTSIS